MHGKSQEGMRGAEPPDRAEIKAFAEGTLMLSFSDARWRLMDIPSKFAVSRRSGKSRIAVVFESLAAHLTSALSATMDE